MAPKKQAKPEHVEGTEPEVEQELSTEVVLENAVPEHGFGAPEGDQTDGSLDDGFVSQSGVDLLEQLLGSSKAEEAKESPKSGLVIPTKEEVEAIVGGDRLGQPSRFSEVFGELQERASHAVEEIKLPEHALETLGLQRNGDYGIVIQIKEGYWSGIQSQAESDNMTPEEWVTMRLAEYLDNWWGPAQSK